MPLRALTGFALLTVCHLLTAQTARVVIDTGPGLPEGYPLQTPLPAGVATPGAIRFARNGSPVIVPVEVDTDRTLRFRAPETKGGSRLVGEFLPDAPAGSWMPAEREGTRLRLGPAEHPVLRYQAEPDALPRADIREIFRRGAYLHPVYTPSGIAVTDDFPPNHIHHHGIWSPWTRTIFEGRNPDFWNMGDGKGRVDYVALEAIWQGPVEAGFRSRHRFIDMIARPEKAALEETWTVRTHGPVGAPGGTVHLIDLEIEQGCTGSAPLVLPEYHYGGLGFRGRREWDGADHCRFLTSEGETNRIRAHGTRVRWCWVGGAVDGGTAGIVLMGHPDNLRAPQPVRVHPTEPFFCFAPQQLGEFRITPDQPYRARYRFVVLDGEPDRAALERWWTLYARPPQVRIEPTGP